MAFCASDSTIGPVVYGCRDNYDLTLLFQQMILSFCPAALFLIIGSFRVWTLKGRSRVVEEQALGLFKQVLATTLLFLEFVLLCVWCSNKSWSSWYSITAAVASVLASALICVLSYLEHVKSIRPSSILIVYLMVSLFTDIIQARTIWLAAPASSLAISLTSSLCIRFVMLFVETTEKVSSASRRSERRCPEDTSSIVNRGAFYWLLQLLFRGSRGHLSPQDLFELNEDMKTERLAQTFKAAHITVSEKHNHQVLARALFNTLRWQICRTILPRLILLACTISSPILLNQLLQYLEDSNRQSRSPGWGFVLAFALVYFGLAVSEGFYWREHFRMLTMLRGCLVSTITDKTTRLSPCTIKDPKAVLTVMSTDVDRAVGGLEWAHELWANILQAGLAAYLLSRQSLGSFAYLTPIGVVFASALGSAWNTRKAASEQEAWTEAVQDRIGLTSIMLSSMKGVRLRCLEDLMRGAISRLRVQELDKARAYRFIQLRAASLGFLPELLAPAFTFLTMIAQAQKTGQPFDATTAFTSLALLNILAQPLNVTIQTMPSLTAVGGCIRRIEKYLNLEEDRDPRSIRNRPRWQRSSTADAPGHSEISLDVIPFADGGSPRLPSSVFSIRDCGIGYKGSPHVLKDLNVEIPRQQFTMIVGPVGSGKTTLCQALLGECEISGQMTLSESLQDIAYCSQQTFLSNTSIRSNIIGFNAFDIHWYQRVLSACALASDIATMSKKDATEVGNNASSLSGGQKQRVALARALYSRKRVIILDDILSGLDARSERHVVENAIGPRGLAREYGASVILATHAIQWLPLAEYVIVLGQNGTVEESGSYGDLARQNGFVNSLHNFESISQPQAIEEGPETSGTRHGIEVAETITADATNDQAVVVDQSRLTGDFTVYRYYLQVAGVVLSVSMIGSCILAAATWTAPSYWLEVWTRASPDQYQGQLYYWGIYTTLQAATLGLLAISCYVSIIGLVRKTGIALHNRMLETVLNAPWSVLSSIDVGSVVNRFSQDIEIMDGSLAFSLMNLQLVSFLGLGQTLLIVISSPWIGLALPVILPIIYIIQNFYLRTSRQLRLMEIEARSPLFTDFTELLQGLSTYRAFDWLQECKQKAADLLERSQEPKYLLHMVQLWLGFVLDILVGIIAVAIVAISISLKSGNGPTGLALTQVMSLGMVVKVAILSWTTLENSLGAVNRIRTFTTTTKSEHQLSESSRVPLHWPMSGQISVENLTAAYNTTDLKPALRDLNIHIAGGHKVGICGPSGSGKSSFILALLHILEFRSGGITIDSVDIASIPRVSLRKSMTVIPQDPVILPGTTRYSLDPLGRSSDADLEVALRKVHLWEVVVSLGGLSAELNLERLSSGQRQLFCLATAILSKAKIVILDEATSNIDHATDEAIQKVIREEFWDRTVIAVAHRLQTVRDFDQIVVLEGGSVSESGSPQQLLARDSKFRQMWQSAQH